MQQPVRSRKKAYFFNWTTGIRISWRLGDEIVLCHMLWYYAGLLSNFHGMLRALVNCAAWPRKDSNHSALESSRIYGMIGCDRGAGILSHGHQLIWILSLMLPPLLSLLHLQQYLLEFLFIFLHLATFGFIHFSVYFVTEFQFGTWRVRERAQPSTLQKSGAR